MANKIIITLDPGHAKNYNQGVVKTYYESNAVYDASLMLKTYLDKYGIYDVKATKPVLDCCPTLAERGKMAIQNKSRMFISLHTNAASAQSAHYTVIFSSVKRKQSDAFERKVSQAISDIMRTYDGVNNNNGVLHKAQSNGSDYYGVLRSAVQSDCIQYVFLIEHAFHTNTKSCNALLKEECWDEMMRTLAELIYDETKKYYVGDNVTLYSGTTTAGLNVRSDPSTSAVKLGLISKGGSVKIVSKTDDWYKILYNGCAAYVSSQYVKTSDTIPDDSTVDMGLPNVDTPTPSDPEIGDDTASDSEITNELLKEYGIDPDEELDMGLSVGKVNCSAGVNVRTGPGTGFDKVGALPQGTKVAVYSVDKDMATKDIGNWYYITTNAANPEIATKGFVCADYITMEITTVKIAVVTPKAGLNYRTGPGTNFPKAGALACGAYVYTLGVDTVCPDWMKIRLSKDDETIYYACAEYLSEVVEDTTDDNTQTQTAFVNAIANCYYVEVAENVNIRARPSESASIILTTDESTIYCAPALVENGTWAKIVAGPVYGYVSMECATIVIREDTEFEEEVTDEIEELIEQIPQLSVKEWFIETLGATITSDYGERIHPISGESSFHYGIDFGAPANTPIRTMVDGIVITNKYDSSFGNYLVILDEQGRRHYFAHMIDSGCVSEGEFVIAGQVIGNVGSTGDSTGNHLHYEVRLCPWSRLNCIDPDSLSFQ